MSKAKSVAERMRLGRTAYHEAGHAVVALRLGRAVESVSIKAVGDSLGVAMLADFPEEFRPDVYGDSEMTEALEREILVSLAGMSAERRFVGRTGRLRRDWRGGSKDLLEAARLTEYIHHPAVVESYLRYMIVRCDVMVSSAPVWAMVEAVAAALLERETMTGPEVRDLCLAV